MLRTGVAAWVVIAWSACGDSRRELSQARTEPGGIRDGGAGAPLAPDDDAAKDVAAIAEVLAVGADDVALARALRERGP